MEKSGFHSELLSIMDVLARAAVAEIDRRVEDRCAVIRLEVSHSRRDINLLRRKCDLMEAELRRTKMRARKRVFYPPASDRFSPLVRVNKEPQGTDWTGETDAEAQNQQSLNVEPPIEAEQVLIKVECAEEEMWKNYSNDKLVSEFKEPPCDEDSQPAQTDCSVETTERVAEPGSVLTTDSYNTFSDQLLGTNQTDVELLVKHETEDVSQESTAGPDLAENFVIEDGDGQLWPSNQWTDTADMSSYVEQHFPSVIPSQSGLKFGNMVTQIQSTGKSNAALSAALVKKRARTFGLKRAAQDGGNGALSQVNTTDQCEIQQLSQQQYSSSMPHMGHQNLPSSSSFVPTRVSFTQSRRMRTPWRSAIGEKRFSCTFCVKTFMRCCQLKEHLRSHTGERPYSCKLCDRSFAKQCNLLRHAVVHSGEKPHECSLCGKCFTQRSSLKSHQKTAH